MQVRSQHKLADVTNVPADTVLICNDDGTPILLAIQMGDSIVVENAASNPEKFKQRLRYFGIEKGPLVEKLKL
jgi:hypothetical protein